MADEIVALRNEQELRSLFGPHDQHLRRIEQALGATIVSRQEGLKISGEPAAIAKTKQLFEDLLVVVRSGAPLRKDDLDYAIKATLHPQMVQLRQIYSERIEVPSRRRFIIPRTPGQKLYVEAMRAHDVVFAIGPAGTGKCVAGSTLVLTDQGLLPIGTLGSGTTPKQQVPIEGIQVAGLDGVERASHVYNGGRSSVKHIQTRLGFGIEATPEHPLLRLNPSGQVEWARADGLALGDYVAVQRGQRLFGTHTTIHFQYQPNSAYDHAKPVAAKELDEDLAYFLGILTGDGCLTFNNRIILSSADPALVTAFASMAKRLGLHVFRNGVNRPYDWIIASSQLYQLLIHLGMSNGPAKTKHVPSAILRSPQRCVIAFLQGLFDTDGTVNRRDGYPQLHSVSKTLIDQVQLLLLNLGILANQRPKYTWYQDQQRLSYQLEIAGVDAAYFFEEVGFRLERKQVLRCDRRRNTNIDVIPHIHQVVRAAVAEGIFSRATHKTLDDYKRGRRNPSYGTLNELIELLKDETPPNPALDTLSQLCDHHFFWAEITSIEDGEADVYDLTVPGSHTFCANGFVNHNTYLAMAMAVAHLTKGEVSRIILTRPAVEAGERLGFLPGDLQEKINPYLRPLYDALYEMMEIDAIQRYLDRGIIEVAPLAYMRGRTLNDAFIILDEAQNSTSEQMKMFLTRLGFDSKAVVTGDITQVDLPPERLSGLIHVTDILRSVPGLKFVTFDGRDVVRHELVQEIIRAYDAAERNNHGKHGGGAPR